MNFLAHENVEIPVDPARRRVSFNIFMREKIHFREPCTGISVIRVFIIEYVEKEIRKIIKFGHFCGFWAVTLLKKVVEVIRSVEKMRLNEI